MRASARPDFGAEAARNVKPAPAAPPPREKLDTSLPAGLVAALDKKVATLQLPDAVLRPVEAPKRPAYLEGYIPAPPATSAPGKDHAEKPAGATPPAAHDADPKAKETIAKAKAAAAKAPTPASASPAEVRLHDGPPPVDRPLPPAQAGQIGAVVAKLLGTAPKIAGDNVQSALGKVVGQAKGVDFGGIDRDLVVREQARTTAQLREIATVAGVTTEQMNAKVAALHQDASVRKDAGLARLAQTGEGAKAGVKTAADRDQKDIAGAAKGVEDKVVATQEAAKGENDPSVIDAKRAEFDATVQAKATAGRARLQSALAARLADLDRVGGERTRGVAGASDAIERLLASYWDEKKAKEGDGVAQQRFDEIRKQQLWKQRAVGNSDAEVASYRNDAKTYVATQTKALDAIVAADLEQNATWAEDHKGFFAGLLARLKAAFTAWGDQVKTDNAAWQHEQALHARDAAAADFSALANLQDQLASGGRAAVEAELAKLDRATAALYRAFLFGGRNAIDVVGALVVARLSKERLPELTKEVQEQLGKLDAATLQKIAGQLSPGFNAKAIARQLRGAMAGIGTKDEKLMAALKGRTPIQLLAIRAAYRETYHADLEADVHSELSGAQKDQADALLSGDALAAGAAELNHVVGVITTSYADLAKLLRGKSRAELIELQGEYERQTGRRLVDQLNLTMSGRDLEAAKALLTGDTARADALHIAEDLNGFIFSPDVKDVAATIEQIRAEVKQELARITDINERRDWMKREFARRVAEMKKAYGEAAGEQLEATLTRLSTADVNGEVFLGKGDVDLITAELEGDDTAIDAAKVEQQATDDLWVSDSEIIKVLEHQVERAREEVQEEFAPRLAALKGRKLTPEQLKAEQTKLRHEAGGEVRRRAVRYMRALGEKFTKLSGGKTLESVIDGMWGVDMEHALALTGMDEDGHKDRDGASTADADFTASELWFAMHGMTNDYDSMKALLAGKSKAEMSEIADAYNRAHPGHFLWADLKSELSGRDGFDVQILAMGTPETEAEKLAILKQKQAFENEGFGGLMEKMARQDSAVYGKDSDFLNSWRLTVGGDESGLDDDVSDAEKAYAKIEAAKLAGDKAAEDEAREEFELAHGSAEQAVENHREMVDSLADNAALVASVVVGVAVSVMTAGTAAPAVIAALSAFYGGAAGLAMKVVIKGNAMSDSEFAKEGANVLIGTALAPLTAGFGHMMAESEVITELLASGRLQAILTQAAVSGVEGAAGGSIGGALGVLIDPDAWRRGDVDGQMFEAALAGAKQGAAMSAALSGVMEAKSGESHEQAVKRFEAAKAKAPAMPERANPDVVKEKLAQDPRVDPASLDQQTTGTAPITEDQLGPPVGKLGGDPGATDPHTTAGDGEEAMPATKKLGPALEKEGAPVLDEETAVPKDDETAREGEKKPGAGKDDEQVLEEERRARAEEEESGREREAASADDRAAETERASRATEGEDVAVGPTTEEASSVPKPGEPLTAKVLREVFGITEANQRAFQLLADMGFEVRLRPTNTAAPELLEAGAAPKPMEVKAKSITREDTYLGFRQEDTGLVGFKKPSAPNLEEVPPALREAVEKRYAKRLAEYEKLNASVDGKPSAMEKLAKLGYTVDENGVIRNPDGKGITGDHDLFEIRRVNKDGSTRALTPEEAEAVSKLMLMTDSAVMHGAHMNMPGDMGAAFDPEAMKIFEDIRDDHTAASAGGREKEPVVVFRPHADPASEFYVEPPDSPAKGAKPAVPIEEPGALPQKPAAGAVDAVSFAELNEPATTERAGSARSEGSQVTPDPIIELSDPPPALRPGELEALGIGGSAGGRATEVTQLSPETLRGLGPTDPETKLPKVAANREQIVELLKGRGFPAGPSSADVAAAIEVLRTGGTPAEMESARRTLLAAAVADFRATRIASAIGTGEMLVLDNSAQFLACGEARDLAVRVANDLAQELGDAVLLQRMHVDVATGVQHAFAIIEVGGKRYYVDPTIGQFLSAGGEVPVKRGPDTMATVGDPALGKAAHAEALTPLLRDGFAPLTPELADAVAAVFFGGNAPPEAAAALLEGEGRTFAGTDRLDALDRSRAGSLPDDPPGDAVSRADQVRTVSENVEKLDRLLTPVEDPELEDARLRDLIEARRKGLKLSDLEKLREQQRALLERLDPAGALRPQKQVSIAVEAPITARPEDQGGTAA